jgi:Ca2+-binding RTX toxin-like protein
VVGSAFDDTIIGFDDESSSASDFYYNIFEGGAGNDLIEGRGGSDALFGGADNDTVLGGDGNDTVDGGDGNDSLSGDAGNDTMSGGTGNDLLFGGIGNDSMDGDSGEDLLDAGAGNDILAGGDGNDTFIGGAGNDTLTGGAGRDIYVLTAGGGADVVTDMDLTLVDGQFTDRIDVSGLVDDFGNPVNWQDAVVASDGAGGSVVTFPGGVSIRLVGIDPSLINGRSALVQLGVPCFGTGTLILTDRGEVPVESLTVGDLVMTADLGLQPVLWAGGRHLDRAGLEAEPLLRPVLIRDGALGNRGDVLVSPNHAVLATVDGQEMLVRAKHLAELGDPRFRIAKGRKEVGYHHLLLERHGLIFAQGMATETLYPGPMAVAALGPVVAAEIARAFPLLAPVLAGTAEAEALYGPTVRPVAKRKQIISGPNPARRAAAA